MVGFSRVSQLLGTAVATQPEANTIWFKTRMGQSSQCCIDHSDPQTIPIDDLYQQLVYGGQTLWIATWKLNDWTVMDQLLWGQLLWKNLWVLSHQKQLSTMLQNISP